jgi:hypothetical protein
MAWIGMALFAAVTAVAVVPEAHAALTPAPASTVGAAAPQWRSGVLVDGSYVQALSSGDRVPGAVVPAAGSGAAGMLVHLGIAGHDYEVPAAAVPYLGQGLDLSLFDVDAVLAAQQANGRIPVQVSTPGADVPGVTQTGGGDGYLTAASARRFGAALAQRFSADRAHPAAYAHATGTARSRLFGGATLRLAGASSGVTPAFDMRTLSLAVTDANGAPDQGDIAFVYNVDDANRFGDPTEVVSTITGGTAKFSVPDGHYAAVVLFFTTDSTGVLTGVRLVSRPEFAVRGDQTLTVGAREATSRITIVTPGPSVPQEGGFAYRRVARTGPSLYVDVQTDPGTPIWVAPTHDPVAVGTLQSYPYGRFTSPPGTAAPYEYQLLMPVAEKTIPAQRYVVRARSVATVYATYYAEVAATGVRQRAGIYGFEASEFALRVSHPLDLPRAQTEYVSAGPDIIWYGGAARSYTDVAGSWIGASYEVPRRYQAGQHVTESWFKFPLHPVGDVQLMPPPGPGWPSTLPGATRTGDTVQVTFAPFTDNQLGHSGGLAGDPGTTNTATYEIDQDGRKMAGGDVSDYRGLYAQTSVDPAASTLRLVYDVSRTGPLYAQSTSSHTEWTWRSSHQANGRLPTGYTCAPGNQPVTDCAVQPLLAVRYDLPDLRPDGSVPPGEQTVNLAVSHLQLAAAAPITAATVEYTTDDGATWLPATAASNGNGRYRASFVPTGAGASGYVGLRVTAHDAAGGGITETTLRDLRLTR